MSDFVDEPLGTTQTSAAPSAPTSSFTSEPITASGSSPVQPPAATATLIDQSQFMSDPILAKQQATVIALSAQASGMSPAAVGTIVGSHGAKAVAGNIQNWQGGLDFTAKQRQIDALSYLQALGDKSPETAAKIKQLQAEQASDPKANLVQSLISGAGEQGAAGLRAAGMWMLGAVTWPIRKGLQLAGLQTQDQQAADLAKVADNFSFGLSPARVAAMTVNPLTGLGESAKEATAGITGPTYRALVDAKVDPDVASAASFALGGILTALQALPAGRLIPGAQRLGESAFKQAVVELAQNGSLTALAKLWGTRVATIGAEQAAIGMANATVNVLGQEWAKQYSNAYNERPLFVTPSMPKPAGMLTAGNINLNNRPQVVINAQALHEGNAGQQEIATVRSISVEMDGKEVLIPTVSDDGKILTNEQAIQQYKDTGKNLGIFKDAASADSYAKQLHLDQQNRKIIPATSFADLTKDILVQAGTQAAVGTAIGGIVALKEMGPTYEMGGKLSDILERMRSARQENIRTSEADVASVRAQREQSMAQASAPIEDARRLLSAPPEEQTPEARADTQAKLDETVKAITANPTPETVPLAIESSKASDAIDTANTIPRPQSSQEYPIAGTDVEGFKVREGPVPNADSIEASFGSDYTVLSGIREIPMSDFSHGKPYSVSETKRVEDLAGQLSSSKEVAPLIVAVDKDGPYILEGGHRFDALHSMGVTKFPAMVVIDESNPPASVGPSPVDPAQIEARVKQGVPVPDATLQANIASPWARDELAARADARDEAITMQESGRAVDAQEFASEMKAVELPGHEKPAAWYEHQWDNMDAERAKATAAANETFVQSLSKDDLQATLHEIASNPEAVIGKALEPYVGKDLTPKDFQAFVAEAAKNPGKFRTAIEQALDPEAQQALQDRMAQAAASKATKIVSGDALLSKYGNTRLGELTTSADAEQQKAARLAGKLLKAAMKEPGPSVAYDSRVAIQQMQDSVSMESGPKLRQTVDRLKAYYASHPDMKPDAATQAILDQKLSGDMTVKDLRDLADKIDAERVKGKALQDIKRVKEQTAIRDSKNRIIDGVESGAGWKALTSELIRPPNRLEEIEKPTGVGSKEYTKARKGNLPQKAQAEALSPLRILRVLGPEGERLWQEENDARSDEYVENDKRIVDPAKAKRDELGIKGHRLATFLKTKDGSKSYTVDDVISMRWAYGNPDSRATLTFGNGITPTEYQELTDQLRPNEKEWADFLQSVFAEGGAEPFDRVTRAYVEDTNEPPPPKVEKWFPIRVIDKIYDAPASEIAEDMSGRVGIRAATPGKRWFQARKNISDANRQAMRLGATALYFEQGTKQEHYINTWATAKKLRKIFSDPKVRDTIAKAYGQDWNKAIDSAITAFANPNALKSVTPMNHLSSAARAYLTSSALVGNLPVFAYHITGPLLYLGDTGPQHILGAIGQWLADPKGVYEEVYTHAPLIKHMSGDPVLDDLLRSSPEVRHQIRSMINRVGFAPFELIWGWIRVMGAKAVRDGDVAAGFSERDAWNHAVIATQKSQPTGSPADLPMMYHADIAKPFLVLSRQIIQFWNMMSSDIPQALKQHKLREALGTMAALAITAMVVGMVKKKGPPKDAKEAAAMLADQTITSIPFVGNQIAPLFTGKGYIGDEALIPGIARTGSDVKTLLIKRQSQTAKINSAIKVAIDASRIVGGPATFLNRLYNFSKTGDPWEFMGGPPKP